MVQAAPIKVTQLFPDGKSVYAFTFDKSKVKWVPWADLLDPTPISPEAEYTNIIVPTVDTVRYTFLLDQLVRSHKHCLMVGPTGTGKTAYIKKYLQGSLPEAFTQLCLNFSAQTSANMTQVCILLLHPSNASYKCAPHVHCASAGRCLLCSPAVVLKVCNGVLNNAQASLCRLLRKWRDCLSRLMP